MTKNATLSVVVPTLGHIKNLKTLLNSLQQQTLIDEFKVLLVDNSLRENSASELTLLLSSFRFKVEYIKCPSRGVNYARNLGLQTSQSELVLFLDDDCWLRDQQLLSKHVNFHQQNPQVFAIGGLYHLPIGKGILDRCYHEVQMRWLQAGIYEETGVSRYLIGGHFSIKRDVAVVNQIVFNEQIIYGGSELSFFRKASDRGLRLSLQNISVVHETRENLISLTRKLFKQGQGKAIIQESLSAADSLTSHQALESAESLMYKLVLTYLDLVFWLGYYSLNKDYKGFIQHLARSMKNHFLQSRQKYIQKLDSKIETKKNRGDLL